MVHIALNERKALRPETSGPAYLTSVSRRPVVSSDSWCSCVMRSCWLKPKVGHEFAQVNQVPWACVAAITYS
jgi:hypothetical protein